MRAAESIVAVALAADLLVTGCTAALQEAPKPTQAVSVQAVKDEAQRAFDEAKSFWEEQGITSVPTLNLPGKDETVTCGTETVPPSKGREVTAAVCYPTNTLLVWPEPLTEQAEEAVNKGAVMRTVVALVIKHEYTHLAQKELNIIGDPKLKSVIEPQADCGAGSAMRGVNEDAEVSIKIYFEGIETRLERPDTKHGNAQQRMASFALGYTPPPDGRTCDSVVPLGN